MDLLMLQVLQQYRRITHITSEDHVILPDDVYGGTFRLTERILNRFNIKFKVIFDEHRGVDYDSKKPTII